MVHPEAPRLARAMLIKDWLEHQAQQFCQIPAYLARLLANNELHTDLNTFDNGFQRLFICSIESRRTFLHMRRIMAVDGTFLKSQFVQILLLAVGIDANGHNLLLVWTLVEGENASTWEWFFYLLKTDIPVCMQMNLISDLDKGIPAGDQALGNGMNPLIYCFHLKSNFLKQYQGIEEYSWTIANAKSEVEYQVLIADLRRVNILPADYLSRVDVSQWVSYYYEGPNFGHKTSNVVESMNNILQKEPVF